MTSAPQSQSAETVFIHCITSYQKQSPNYKYNSNPPNTMEMCFKKGSGWFQTLLQSYSNQNSLARVRLWPVNRDQWIQWIQYRSMNWSGNRSMNREPRNKPSHIWSINLWQRSQEYTMGERQSLQWMMLGKLDRYMQKNKTRPLS